ncbi:phasin family protein (plasmid) [Cupriavidus pauculus]|uniref:Phasin family protein n=1 Tax=Cupriavidus pauculus TaxID=82633 RepID=A0A5P2H8V9_9BURK|nr:TIGR01841 family phasin [Cupriavidus pauculus]QET03943.1 phasin family protein [Cupriavidus pauculus]
MATSPKPPTDFTTILEQYKLPGVDMASIIDARRKDIEAITQANRVAYEGMQMLVQKQLDIFNKTIQQIQAEIPNAVAGTEGFRTVTQQSELVQQRLHTAFKNMREMAEMAQKSQSEALAVMTRRADQNIDAAKGLMRGTGKLGR